MKQTVTCKIEITPSPDEIVWNIVLTEAAAFEAAILLSTLNQGKLPQVRFADKSRTAVIRCTPEGNFLILTKSRCKTQIPVTKSWPEELSGDLMYAYATGGANPVCVDQVFCDQNGSLRITIRVAPSAQ